MTTVVLRPAAPRDDGFLASLYASTRDEEMALVPWNEDEKNQFLDFQYRAQATSYETRFPNSDHRIIVVDGVPVGRIWTDEWEEEIRLLDIAILPQFRGTGIGSELLRNLQSRARSADKALRHSVRIGNAAAIRLYERLGFTIYEEYDFETHHLMEWTAR